jgi:hypothetical protein
MGGYLDAKNKSKQQDFENQLKTSQDTQAQALARSQISKTDQDIAASKSQVSREDLDSASNRVHQAASDALAQAKFQYDQTHDAALYKQQEESIRNTMTLGMAQIAASKSNAQLAASTQMAVANISATTQRRGQDISASTERRGQDVQASTAAATRGENAREFDIGNTTTRRGQDITREEYATGARGNINKAFAPDLGTIKANPNYKQLPIQQQLTIEQGVTKYGAQGFLDKIRQNGPPPGTTADDAQSIVNFLSGG